MTLPQIRFAGFLLAGMAGMLAWSQLPPPQPLIVHKIADDLHMLEGPGGNVAVLTTAEGTVIVDDKFAPNVPQIYEAAKKLSDKPIRYILNTHHHGDHTGGNAGLAAKEPIEILAHANARDNMMKANMPGTPRVGYRDAVHMGVGGTEIRAIHLGRGHTNGDAVVFWPKHRVIHMGDLFSVAGPFVDYANGGSALEWVKTLDKALTYEFDTVIPGHGAICKKADLAEYRKKMAGMVKQMEDLKAKGMSKDEAVKAFDPAAIGWKPGPLFARGLPGLYDEVGK